MNASQAELETNDKAVLQRLFPDIAIKDINVSITCNFYTQTNSGGMHQRNENSVLGLIVSVLVK